MKFSLNGTWINDYTITKLPVGATALSNDEWENRKSVPYTPTQSELDAAFNAVVDSELVELDKASIRDIREYISAQPDAPQRLKDREAEVVAKRATRKI